MTVFTESFVGFNSRSREGSDRLHASTRGPDIRFNSRSREGSDFASGRTSDCLMQFQFTLPRGERPKRSTLTLKVLVVSIHAPARGATSIVQLSQSSTAGFNSRSREGSDLCD